MAIFGWTKKKIKELQPAEMSHYATALLRKSGRNQTSFRLIYQALVVNPYEPEALLRLAEFYDDGRTQHRPDPRQTLSALVLDYALGQESRVPYELRTSLQKLRLKLVWAWGYAKGDENSATFQIDDEGFLNAVSNAAAPYRTFTNAFISAHTILGEKAGLLVSISRDILPWDALKPWEISRSKYMPSPAYPDWLNSDASFLERLTE